MALLVQKFGGTSVGDIKKIQNIAPSICHSKEAGNEIVVVVSAMGQTTDDLIVWRSQLVKILIEENWICFSQLESK